MFDYRTVNVTDRVGDGNQLVLSNQSRHIGLPAMLGRETSSAAFSSQFLYGQQLSGGLDELGLCFG